MCLNEIEYLLRKSQNMDKEVIFVTQGGDSLYIDALKMDGYEVTTTYPGTEGWDFSLLNFADLVVIGRSIE